uniref:Chemokine interleukin-8-like domain-containing protein n=1 Tax=Neogobius melanostomus TaxID=47308 RepID=A0A8C6WRH3_9GOBI
MRGFLPHELCQCRQFGKLSSSRRDVLVIKVLLFSLVQTYTPCCRRYSTTKLPFSKIIGLSIQTDREMCHINAIIFHTHKGKVCFNPASNWVMDYVNRLR